MLLPLFLGALSGLCMATGPIVNTPYGAIEGFSAQSASGVGAEVFLGVPYAKPPVGDLRFRKTKPIEPWTGVLQATAYKPICASFPAFFASSSEDCLIMNIVKPANLSDDPKGYPVIVYIHGGGFAVGSAQDLSWQATVENLAPRGVVHANIQYRLGPFGTFTTGDDRAKGNYGLWDQVQALKFVRKVIGAFNGNKHDVTIMGQSSGSMSISYLNFHPGANKLFKRSIALSGSAGAVVARGKSVEAMSDKLAELVDCDGPHKMDCMRNLTAAQIVGGFQTLLGSETTNRRPDCAKPPYWTYRFDNDFVNGEDFEEAVKRSPPRPYFMGVCSQEMKGTQPPAGNSKGIYYPLPYNVALNFNESLFDDTIEALFGTEIVYGNRREEALNRIFDYYKNNANYTFNFYLQTYFQIFSDTNFNVPALREAKLKAKHGAPVYFYRYSYTKPGQEAMAVGASHGAELTNQEGLPNLFTNPDDYLNQQRWLELMMSFVKEGSPTSPTAGPLDRVGHDRVPFLDIKVNSVKYDDLWPDRLQFWNEMRRDFNYDWPSGVKKGPHQVVQCPNLINQ